MSILGGDVRILFYIGCSDDVGTMYSIGEQFNTLDNITCSCGEGYSISCKRSLSSDQSGSYVYVTMYVHLLLTYNFMFYRGDFNWHNCSDNRCINTISIYYYCSYAGYLMAEKAEK